MDSSNLIGTRLGKYELHAEIGKGGMGTVYKGYDPMLDSWVAVKVLAPHLVWEQKFVERFIREARAARKLRHPGIVTVYDVGQEAGWYYIVMEYLEGQTLTELIRERGPVPPEEAVRFLRPLAEALDYAHHKGLVHRDVKPGNVIVDPAGQVTLTDFGIARAPRETRLTATGTVVGTPEYMSPEQVQGLTVDARSDQYSLGVVAYEILSGRVPFEAESTLALLYKVVHEPPPPIRQARPDLSVGVEGVLRKVLAKDPGDRYATASGFVEALGQALAGEEVVKAPTLVMEPEVAAVSVPVALPAPVQPVATAASPTPTPAPAGRRVPVWGWALGGLAVLALVVGVVMAVGGGGRPEVGATPTAAVVVAQATSTLRPTSISTDVAIPTAQAPRATPTHTPTRTPKPTPLPTATIDADPTVYDNFDNPANDGSFNRSQWVWNSVSGQTVVQRDGVLELTELEGSEGGDLFARRYTQLSLKSPIFYESRFMLSADEHAGGVILKVHADLPREEYYWFSQCGIDVSSSSSYERPWIYCIDQDRKKEHHYFAGGKYIDFATWHTVRIEIDPTTMIFTYYIDGQMVGSHVPVDAPELKTARFSFVIGVYSWSGRVVSYIDDVRIGQVGQ